MAVGPTIPFVANTGSEHYGPADLAHHQYSKGAAACGTPTRGSGPVLLRAEKVLTSKSHQHHR